MRPCIRTTILGNFNTIVRGVRNPKYEILKSETNIKKYKFETRDLREIEQKKD